jgi:hypothetical protein
VIPAKGGKWFAQIHSDEPLHECKVLGSAWGSDEDSAVVAAMEKANVVDLADGPRPRGAIAYTKTSCSRVIMSQDIKSSLAICGEAVDALIGAIRGH